MMKNPLLHTLISVVITLLIPIGLIITSVRIVLLPWYPKLEYRTPWFPEDRYGFTRTEREHYALIALDYLNTNKNIHQLMDLRFPEGQTTPPISCLETIDCNLMFNGRELQHMIDVKFVLGIILPVGYTIIGVLILLGWWARKRSWWNDYLSALRRGGWLTISLLVTLIVLVIGVFDWFFTEFHQVFFSSGTWQFYTSDTLIRLFPERFWMDTFIIVGGIAALGGLAFIIIGKKAGD